ncbi:MAG: hypothetical protein PHY64_00630 [Eubacteriales bacterium]|nr:hypothetical protein [Eubacteriales bacterium]
MRNVRKLLALLLAAIVWMGCAAAEEAAQIAAVVNGEDVLQSEVDTQLAYYRQLYAENGVDTADETIAAYLESMALTAAISDRLLVQDMTAKGVFAFTEEETSDIQSEAQSTYAALATQRITAYRSTEEGAAASDDEALAYAENDLQQRGYTLAYFNQYYRNDVASQKYADLLMEGETISDEEVQTAYEARVAESKTAYEGNVSAYETALNNGEEVWYVPAGYRNVLQILIRSDAEDKLADTADTVAAIYSALEAGTPFEELIRTYGEDSAFDIESFFSTGYMVNKDSVLWDDAFVEAAFSEDMLEPGDYTGTAIESDVGVHILYYLSDHPAGVVELTDDVKEALRETLYGETANQRVQARLAVLQDEADVQLTSDTQ